MPVQYKSANFLKPLRKEIPEQCKKGELGPIMQQFLQMRKPINQETPQPKTEVISPTPETKE